MSSLALIGLSLPAGAAIVNNPAIGYPFTTVPMDGEAPDPELTGTPWVVDFNADGQNDMAITGLVYTSAGDAAALFAGAGSPKVGPGGGRVQTGGPFATLLSAGTPIPVGAPTSPYAVASMMDNGTNKASYGPYDLLDVSQRAYVGVAFTSVVGTHAAWLDLEGNGAGSLIVHGWGWETTPNTPILAGAVGVLDEPSGGGAGGPAAVAAAQANTNTQIGQYRAMQANQAHARRVAERQRLQAARR